MALSRMERKSKQRHRRRTYLLNRSVYLVCLFGVLTVGALGYLVWGWIEMGAPHWPQALIGGGATLVVICCVAATKLLRNRNLKLPTLKLPNPNISPRPRFSAKDSFVGLDVGTSSIKLVQVVKGKDGPRIVQYGIFPTPAKAVENGIVKDREVIIPAVRQLFQERKIKQDRVITVLTGQNLIVRHVEFPKMTENELREALKWEAEQYIPIPKDDSVVDFQVIPPGEGGQSDHMQVMLVATYRRPIQDYIDLVKAAKLKPQAIDIEPLAVLRAVQIGQPGDEGVTAIIDMGAGTTNLSIFVKGVLQMTRIIPIAGNDLTQSIADGLGQSFAAADQLKKQGGLLDETLQPLLAEQVDKLIGEIRRSLEFFLFKNRDLSLAKVYLVGGGCYLRGFDQLLTQELGSMLEKLGVSGNVSVEIGHPSQHMDVDPQIAAELRLLDTILVPALGLALREVVS